jgi:hypothetical protein
VDDGFEGWVGFDGFVESAGDGDVGNQDIVNIGGIFRISGEESLCFFFGADSEADVVSIERLGAVGKARVVVVGLPVLEKDFEDVGGNEARSTGEEDTGHYEVGFSDFKRSESNVE